MRTYTVHTPPPDKRHGPDTYVDRFVFVRDGFRWLAFLSPGLWLLFNRLWLPLLGYLALCVALGLLAWATGLQSALLPVGLALNWLVGLEVDALKRWSLERRGWRMAGIVAGREQTEAEHVFFSRYGDGGARPYRSGAQSSWDSGMVGLFTEPAR